MTRRGKPMGGDLLADCRGKNMGFSTPFGAVLSMKKAMAFSQWRKT